MTAAATTGPRFEIARVVNATVSVIRAHWRAFLPMALLLVGLPELVFSAASTGLHEAGAWSGAGSMSFVGTLLTFAGNILLQGALIHGTAAAAAGRTLTAAEMLSAARPVFWPLMGAEILMALGVLFGLILLIVPGVLLGLAWYVIGPVVTLERARVGDAFRRSAELTRNHRWELFWATVVLCLALLAAAVALSLIFLLFQWVIGRPAAVGLGEAASAVVGAVVGSVWVTCVYAELNALGRGAEPAAGA